MPTEKSRYTIIVDDKLLKRIDDFRFENRYPSRSAATLDLIRFGLEALEKSKPRQKKRKSHAAWHKTGKNATPAWKNISSPDT